MKSTSGKPQGDRTTRVFHHGKIIRHPVMRTLPVLAGMTFSALGGEHATLTMTSAKPGLSDITLANVFSAGWDEPWTKRSRGDGTPNMSLLRVQTNFLAQLLRTDYVHQGNLNTAEIRAVDSLSGTLEYALNRRLMIAVIGNYAWKDFRESADVNGAAGGAFVRLQLVDTACSSLATTLKVALPNHDLGEKDSTLGFSIAGWRDLAPLGLKRTGLYFHIQEETLAGPRKAGARRNDLTYAVSLAKTWTSPDSLFGNTSTFVEAYGKSDLDGTDRGHTIITLTPGIRATFDHRHIVMAGVEFPLTNPMPFERIVRLAYVWSF